jgi:hypothetical protein
MAWSRQKFGFLKIPIKRCDVSWESLSHRIRRSHMPELFSKVVPPRPWRGVVRLLHDVIDKKLFHVSFTDTKRVLLVWFERVFSESIS